MNINPKRTIPNSERRGSTLIIVIALLGLLAFTGMVFFTFAAQERAAAEYFSESAKSSSEEVEDPFPWAMQQIIVGANNQPEQKGSILWSPTQRHSIVRNMVGNDVAPHTGTGIHVVLDLVTGFPVIDNDYNGTQDSLGTNPTVTLLSNKLNFVDAQAGWGRSLGRNVEGLLAQYRPIHEVDLNNNGALDQREDFNNNGVLDADEDLNGNGFLDGGEDRTGNGFLDVVGVPAPDVDYTYPDINHLFLGYKGWAIRDNGNEEDLNLNGVLDSGEDANSNGRLDRRYEQARMLIPSFFRPQYMKSAANQGKLGLDVPTDPDWFDETVNVTHQQYSVRSFRPHAYHITGFDASGNPVLRFLDRNNPAHAAAIAALPGSSGHFPLRRNEGNAATQFNGPNFGKLGVWTGDGAATADTFELDSDNDGDGIREGIWLDLRYPLQETADGRKYTVLHSFTIYDLDGLIDLNTHGNLAGLPRDAVINAALTGPGGLLESTFLSQSNSGVGPHEINPTYALAPGSYTPDAGPAFTSWYLNNPTNRLAQANMELGWLLTGRIDLTDPASPKVYDGKWGDASALWYHRFNAAGGRRVNVLPRPGRAGNLSITSTDVANNFGGAAGFDDNQDLFEGIASANTGRKRGVVHPTDFSGRGRRTDASNPLSPILVQPTNTLPEQWPGYLDYPLLGNSSTIADNGAYIGGRDGDVTTAADNLVAYSNAANASNFNQNFEDPYETIVDIDRAVRPDDQIFTPLDLISAHLTKTDEDNATGLSNRLENLAPFTFADNSSRAEFFTTLSNSFRHFSIAHDLKGRPWEWTANSDKDGFFEFPPKFGTVAEFDSLDPFRPQARRLLLTEAMEGRGVSGQLPLSLNHILDVVRSAQTPREGTPEFQRFMQRTGLRFRPLTEHPLATEVDGAGATARETVMTIPTVITGNPLPEFPPKTFQDREFWARRDRQQMARDLFVLLYTVGGAEFDTTVTPNRVRDYTGDNSVDTAGSPPLRRVYQEDRVRLMAQFAVNVIDAMDADNVITKFEYDKNLHDGWGLDDDAYTFTSTTDPASGENAGTADLTKSGMYPDDAGDRGVVYGVEAQQLAFSEVLGIRSANAADNDATPYGDDRTGSTNPTHPTYFLFTELQNMLPTKAVLGSGLASGETAAKSVWRLVRKDRTIQTDPSQLAREAVPAVPPAYLAFATNARNEIEGGGRFTISATTAVPGTSGITAIHSSDFYVDIGTYDGPSMSYMGIFDDTFELIAPKTANGTLPTSTTPATDPAWSPRCDLDLIVHTSAYYQSAVPAEMLLPDVPSFIYNGHHGILERDANRDLDNDPATNPAPVFLEPVPGISGDGFDLVLERRLNPDLPSVGEIQNPWIEVDRIRVPFRNFDIAATDTADDIRNNATRLQAVFSTERSEPLQNALTSHAPITTGATAFRSNTLKGDSNTTSDDTLGANSSSTAFTVWQPHFDREFVSPGELLNIPIYPPNMLTQRLASARRPPFQQLAGNSSPVQEEILNAAGAASMFLWPDWTQDLVTPDAATADDNRWYRLLQFVEVPSRVNRTIGNYINLKRLPGKLNPNTIRDREIYAGLLDDPQFMETNPLSDLNGNTDLDGPFTMGNGTAFDGRDGLDSFPATADSIGKRDRWLELINERDGNVRSIKDPTPNLPGPNIPNDEVQATYWIPGAANSRPFRSYSSRTTKRNDDNAFEQTMLRRLALDKPSVVGNSRANVAGDGNTSYVANLTLDPDSNRQWLEVGDQGYHKTNQSVAPLPASPAATIVEHHQLLSKIMNNTTTVSNTFIMYGTAAYFEVYEDPVTGLVQVGGRMGLDVDGDSDPKNDGGWEQRAVFILDRTELYNAYDPGSGSVDWKRLVKHRVNLPSDGR
jgi:hypothetical protein